MIELLLGRVELVDVVLSHDAEWILDPDGLVLKALHQTLLKIVEATDQRFLFLVQ